MKLSFVAAACVATGVAADAEPPVITLNFDAKSDYAKIMKLKNSVIRGHDLGYKNNGKSQLRQVKKVSFAKRATYLFKFDATDSANNHAEQIVFGLILDDVIAPKISICGKAREVVEAASQYKMCSTSVARDNLDKNLKIKYS